MALLIEGGLIVTGDAQDTRLEAGDVLVEGDRIAKLGRALAAGETAMRRDLEIIDARRSIVMPGLVNAHTHSNEAFEQGAYDNLPLELWLLQTYPPFGMPELSEREHYLRTMICAVESIRGGATTVQDDIIHPFATPDAVDGAAKAYRDAGLRAFITVDMWDRPFLDCLPFVREIVPPQLRAELEALPPPTRREQIDLFRRHFARWQGTEGRIAIILGPCGPQRCTVELLQEVTDLSQRHHLPVHTHVLETKTQAVTGQVLYGKTLVEHMHAIGMLTPRLTLNHAIWLTDRDIELLGDHGCSITHNPLSNLKLGSGVCPVRALLEAGVNVALGTDGLTTSDTGDMVEALRAASLLHKIGTHATEAWVSAAEAFRMATVAGARSCLAADQIGSIEVGKKADIILLDREAWGFIPLHDPVRQLAFSATSEAITHSIIDGRVVMRDRRLTLIDEAAVKREVMEAAERFRRDHLPAMQAGAGRLAPHIRAVYDRATAMEIRTCRPPRRPPPIQSGRV